MTLSRRSLISFAAVAPAIVRCPSLMELSRLKVSRGHFMVDKITRFQEFVPLYGSHGFPVDIGFGEIVSEIEAHDVDTGEPVHVNACWAPYLDVGESYKIYTNETRGPELRGTTFGWRTKMLEPQPRVRA